MLEYNHFCDVREIVGYGIDGVMTIFWLLKFQLVEFQLL